MRLAILSALLVILVSPQTSFSQVRIPAPSSELLNFAVNDYQVGICPESATSVIEDFYQQRRLLEARSIELIDSAEAVQEYNALVRNLSTILREKAPEYHALLSLKSMVSKTQFDARVQNSYAPLFFLANNDVQSKLQFSSSQRRRLDSIAEKVNRACDRSLQEFDQKMKLTLKECYIALKNRLSESERTTMETVYGEPLAFEEFYRFAGPLTLNDRYRLPDQVPKEFVDDFEVAINNYGKRFDGTNKDEFPSNAVDTIIVKLLLSDALELDKKRQREFMKRMRDGDGVLWESIDKEQTLKRAILIQEQKMEYPAALQELLSEDELQRLSQLEYQLRQRTIVDFGLAQIDGRSTLVTSEESAKAVFEECESVKKELAEESRHFQRRISEILREGFDEAKQVLTSEQRSVVFPKLLPKDTDIVEMLTGIPKDVVEEDSTN